MSSNVPEVVSCTEWRLPKDQGALLQLLVEEMLLPEPGHPCQLCVEGSSYDLLVMHLERAATFSCRPLRVNREPNLRCRYVQRGQDLLSVS